MVVQDYDGRIGRILIVDDDERFRESLIENLSDAGFATMAFESGARALRHLAEVGFPDIILLDWKMPEMTGIELLAELRRRNIATPVVFLTVLGDQIYEEAGLHGGAVDFIEKSRGFSIMLRRIELALGWQSDVQTPPLLQQGHLFTHGHLELRRDIQRASWKDAEVGLTATEFRIVDHLATRVGHDVRYRQLYDIVHGEGFAAGSGEVGYRVNVRSFIKRIRQKFQTVDPEFAQIENYLGFGYRWSEQDNPSSAYPEGEITD